MNGADPIAFGYDADGLLIQAGGLGIARSAQNDLITGTTVGSTADTLEYNNFGEPESYTAAWEGTALVSFAYIRDKLGRIAQKTETRGGVTDVYAYAYDTAGRLTAVTRNALSHEFYAYDSNGNRLTATTQEGTKSGTYDDQDRLLQYGSATYAYSANGDLVTKTVGGQTTTYDYDTLGNLRGVTLPGGTQIAYVIDGLNRRVGKKVDGALVQAFLYEELLHPVAELDGSGNVVSRFVYGTGGDVPDYLVRGGNTYRVIPDHLGSPRLVVDVATGAIAQQIAYDSFGNVISDSNPGFQPFGFAGGIYDRDTKLTRFGARDYDAETGRWTAKDPILFAGGAANLYGYVSNDPTNHTDVAGWATSARGPRPGGKTGIPGLDIAYKITEEYVRAKDRLAKELEAEIERVRQIREEAERLRKRLERLLEELRRMFPCHKRGTS